MSEAVNGVVTAPDGLGPVSMIERVVEILSVFNGDEPLGLTQVVNRSGLPRSSVHRILEQLVAVKWLIRTGSDYQLGTVMVEFGQQALRQSQLYDAALPILYALESVVHHVVHLAVLDVPDVVYLVKLGGRFAAGLPSQVGRRAPAHCTGVGKAMLAHADPAEVGAVLAGPLRANTRYSITDPRVLEREFAQIRRQGVAYDREEAVIGVSCAAAPIRRHGAVVAAISITGPTRAIDLADAAIRAKVTAVQVSRALDQRDRDRERRAEPLPSPVGSWERGQLDAVVGWRNAHGLY